MDNQTEPIKPANNTKPPKTVKARKKKEEIFDPSKALKNANHEAFSYRYAITGNATRAYMEVYESPYDTAKSNACRLLTYDVVKQRVEFLQKAQSNIAFATLTRNLNATKTLVHDKDSILTEVEDPQAQIAAAATMLKANGKFGLIEQVTVNTTNTVNMLVVNNMDKLERAIAMIKDMHETRARGLRPTGVIDVEIENGDRVPG